MKRTGIITFHRADNLGAVLQAYALQSALKDNYQTDVTIIDYICPSVESGGRRDRGLRGLALRGYYFWKHRGFERFRKRRLPLSARYSADTVAECVGEYDVFITGSDQVWNYECSGWDDVYFLDFVLDEKKKYSYAASLGNYRFAPSERDHVRELLGSFSGISVREESGQRELESLGTASVGRSPDPVILLTQDQWMEITPPRRCRQPYIFVYLIQQDVNVMNSARAYAREHNCRIICNKTSPEFILRGGPTDFLSWICYAECVFTNSFHGTAFALIFNRPLAADIQLENGGINHRVREILEAAGARQCMITHMDASEHTPNAWVALERMRTDAFHYLEKIYRE